MEKVCGISFMVAVVMIILVGLQWTEWGEKTEYDSLIPAAAMTAAMTFCVSGCWCMLKQLAKARARQAQKKAQKQALNKFEKRVKQWLKSDLFLDSNIWMGGDDNPFLYDTFFELLKRWTAKSKPIQLPGVQFDEICHIKTKNKSTSNSKSSARRAIGRIENFQKEEKLIVSQVTIDSQFSAYAAPALIKIILSKVSAGFSCTVISNNKELRIRLRQKLTDSKLSNCAIIDINEIFDEFQAVF